MNTREILYDNAGRVGCTGLDDIEYYILHSMRGTLEALRRTADRLRLVPKLVAKTEGRPLPFEWTDLRYGGGEYQKIPTYNGKRIRFAKKKGPRTDDDPQKELKIVSWYTVDPDGVDELDLRIIKTLLPTEGFGPENFPGYFRMRVAAAVELARRLGYEPVLDELS